ncbi:hypothetical protein OMD46_13595 [Pseudomonas sp. MDMC_285]|nr:hypothetical protein [Pseudomonas sp. MDMC_285]
MSGETLKKRLNAAKPEEVRADEPTRRRVSMLKFLGGTVGIIFIIGLIVVVGLLSLIF